MLKNSESLTEFAREHRTLFEKICDAVFEFIEKIRGAITSLYGNEAARNPEAQFMELYSEELQKVFDKALSDALNASEATVDHNLPKNEKTAENGGKVQYSKGKSSYDEWDVQAALYDVLDHEDTDRNDYLIKVGAIPKYITDKLGIEGDFYIYRNHIYENMVSKEQAIEDGRYVAGKHYHDLGFETTEAAIMALENPILSIASKTDKNNPAVIMILPVTGKNGVPLYSIMSLYSSMSVNGDFSTRPHVVLSIYERNMEKAKEDKSNKKARDKSLEEIINEAVREGKVFDFDKKMRDALSVIAEQARLGDITETSLTDSLTQFRKEIKTFKEKNKIQYSRGDAYDPYEPYTPPAYATMPEFYAPLEGEYGYRGEGYTAENGLKLFTKYSVDTARDFIMSELILSEGKVELARDLNEFYTFMATAEKLTWEDIEKRAGEIADRHLSKRSERVSRDPRAQEALDTIRDIRISFDEKQKADAKAYSGSFGKYRQSLMGRVNITRDGIPLDSIWQEWAEEFPQYFPSQRCYFRPFHCCFDQNIHKILVIFVYKQY